MLDDKAPLSDDEIDDILDALCSFGGTIAQTISKPKRIREPAQGACEREMLGACTVLRPVVWRR